jgi:CBS domain-containing protein
MGNSTSVEPPPLPFLATRTAADLMTPNPLSIRDDATVTQAVAFLTDKGFSAAPVIDEAGRSVGVLSRGDILTHERERRGRFVFPTESNETTAPSLRETKQDQAVPEEADPSRVRDLMTPALFSVPPKDSASRVARQMVELNVHHLFVVDQSGIILGVISALDILRHLCAAEQEEAGQASSGTWIG